MVEVRLQKYLAECGVASRRKSEELIKSGQVAINGKVVTELGTKVSEKDEVTVEGRLVSQTEQKVYVLLNKPTGYVTTVKDQFGRASVVDLIKEIRERVYPVGRLDYDTSGLLILTNDGELTYHLTHPKHEIEKVYNAFIEGVPTEEEIKRFQEGLKIEDYITSPAKFRIIKKENRNTWVEIVIHEGKNRQVRKMCEAIGHKVIALKRIAIGSIILGNLEEGKWRYMRNEELDALKNFSIELSN
ncbi:MAG: rRNA pseudouridine synthase [Clostridia bacterium]|nr:rRNA pseudouridine synthase [Clostridia bacterium]